MVAMERWGLVSRRWKFQRGYLWKSFGSEVSVALKRGPQFCRWERGDVPGEKRKFLRKMEER